MPKLYSFQADAVQQILKHQYATNVGMDFRKPNADLSALIGDDMGLGKTVEAIALDLNYRRYANLDYTARTLVVTQTSVMGSWKKHYNEWAPWLNVIVIDRKNRNKFLAALKEPTTSKSGYQIFICHWQVLRFIADELREQRWFHIIGDEIHNIKNRKAQQTQVYKKIGTYYKTGLSGTWADNRPDDAWSVLNWLWPKKFTSYYGFFNHHVLQKKHDQGTCMAEGCDKYHRRAFTEIVGVHDVETIHARMGNAYVRRTKDAVWAEMPEKVIEDREVELTPQQRRTYDAMEKDMITWVGQHEDQPLPAPTVVSQLVRLQQFAVAYGRLELKTVTKTIKETGEKYQEQVRQLILDEPSSKLDVCMDIIEATNAQIVVFGQSKQAINLLAKRLQAAGIPTGVLTGDVSQADRDLAVDQFQQGKLRVFLSTIKAGGVGITLTAASICIFLDRAWSPTANKQAEDRLHRLGQKNAVYIITLVARDTIDPTRNAKIEMKWTWLKQVLERKEAVTNG